SWQSANQPKEVIPSSQLFAPPAPITNPITFKGNPWTAFVAFNDPGTDTFTGSTINYGDDTGTVPLTVSGRAFTLSHVYQHSGDYTVTVTLADGDGGTTTTSFTNSIGYSGVILGDQPIGYWRLGETSGTTAVDATGHSNGT